MNVDTVYGPMHLRHYGGDYGRPVVLVHPLAMSGEIWQPMGEWLGRDERTVVAPDVPVGDPGGVTVADMAAQVITAIDHVGAPVDLIGMSMGGCVSLQVALERPDLLRHLVLADTTATYGPDRVAYWEQRARTAETSTREQLLDFQVPRWFTDRFRADDPDEVKRAIGIFVATTPATHAACSRALGGFDVSARLDEVRTPTLVLVGEQDTATPPAMAEALAAGIHGARLALLPGVRHFSLLESRDAWQRIDAYLSAPADA
jgi:3-oxoadipate enol-lactonase